MLCSTDTDRRISIGPIRIRGYVKFLQNLKAQRCIGVLDTDTLIRIGYVIRGHVEVSGLQRLHVYCLFAIDSTSLTTGIEHLYSDLVCFGACYRSSFWHAAQTCQASLLDQALFMISFWSWWMHVSISLKLHNNGPHNTMN